MMMHLLSICVINIKYIYICVYIYDGFTDTLDIVDIRPS